MTDAATKSVKGKQALVFGQDGTNKRYYVICTDDQGRIVLSPTGGIGASIAALLAICTEARLSELDAGNIPADIDTLLARLTAARAAYLDELAAANLPADVAAIAAAIVTIDTVVDAIKVATDKLAGTVTDDTTTANWNTGTGTSGEAGDDLCTIGANDTKYKLHSLVLNVSACTNGAVLTVKGFMQVNGTERKVYSQNFLVNTDPDGLWIIQATVGIHEALRIEVYSDTNENVAIEYDYMLEAM